MLYWLLYRKLYLYFSPFRIFRYLTFRTAFASLTALLITLIIGPFVIEKLREFQIGQYIREEGPKAHQKKAGTPTMGGVLICIAILLPTFLWADLSNPFVWVVMFSTAAFGAIGFADDYIKVVHRRNLGLTARAKLLYQFLVAGIIAVVLVLMDLEGSYSTRLMVPFVKVLRPRLSIPGAAAHSASRRAGVSAVHRFRDAGDRVFQQRGEPDGRPGRAGDWLHHHRRRRADGADLCERARDLRGLPGAAAHADGERGDRLLRGDDGGEHRFPLVQRAPGGDFHGRRGVAGAGRGDCHGCRDHQAGAAAAVYRRRLRDRRRSR